MANPTVTNPTLTARALGVALFEFNLTVAAFRDGKCKSTKVDDAYRKVERIAERVQEIKREAELIAQAAFRESCKAPHHLQTERAFGFPPMRGVKPLGISAPLVRLGPGGDFTQDMYFDESGCSAGAGSQSPNELLALLLEACRVALSAARECGDERDDLGEDYFHVKALKQAIAEAKKWGF